MEFRLSEDQERFRRAVADFVDAEIAPVADELDAKGEFPLALFRRLGELGYFGLRYPEEVGGAGADMVTYCLWAEELARGSMSVAAIACMQSLMGTHFVFTYGGEELRRKYLIPALRGERIGTFALTEPNAGSDIGNITTFAERRGDAYVLRGTKTWVTMAPVADFLTVAAKTSRERGMRHIALFLVDPREMPGVTLGKQIEKMGVRAAHTGEIVLEDVLVPASHLLGGETGGVEKVGGILAEIRVMTGALGLGLARAAYQAALGYSRERVAFGKPIGEHQAIAFKLADMLTTIHAATLMTYHAAWCLDRGLPAAREAAMAKLFAAEVAMWCAHRAVQLFGGYGYIQDYPVERYFRDAKITEIYEGTSEIQRVVIARHLLG